MKNYEEIISFASLYKANRSCLNGKRSKAEAIVYQEQLGTNLTGLHYKLKYNNYQINDYHRFMIYDPKKREIQAISYEDRIVQKTICDNYLNPLLDRYLIYHDVACRKNKGTALAMTYLKNSLRKMWLNYGDNFYVIKIDISKYFENIDHDVLKEKIRYIVEDSKIYNLLSGIIDSFNFETNKGLPMGNQTSQCFALLYLNSIDHLIKEKLFVNYYVRYMDDMLLLVKSKEEAMRIYKALSEEVSKLKLAINPKSTIIKITKGFEFLGRYFTLSNNGGTIIRLKRNNKLRVLKHAKSQSIINSDTRNIAMLAGYNGFFSHINNYNVFLKISGWCKIKQ